MPSNYNTGASAPDYELRFSTDQEEEDRNEQKESTSQRNSPEPIRQQTYSNGVYLHPFFLRRLRGHLFALKNNSPPKGAANVAAATTGRSFNYEEIYDEDKYGEETFPDARVWRVYNDEAQLFDFERIESWRDAIDVLLVFIGLFAAVVSAFLIESAKSLQPDYAQITAVVSIEILRSLNASILPNPYLSSTFLNPRFGDANPSKDNNVVNALWYTSLTISLSTALLAMLVKQWLHQYMTSTSGTARDRAHLRHFRFVGLDKYRVPFIIDLLPVLLHVALALFMAGLAISLKSLHVVIFSLVVAIAAIPYLLYITSIIIPLFDPQCPYKSPPSFHVYWLYRFCCGHFPSVIMTKMRILKSQAFSLVTSQMNRRHGNVAQNDDVGESISVPSTEATISTLTNAEKQVVALKGSQLDVDAIVNLYQTSANTSVRDVAFEAFGGLPPSNADLTAIATIMKQDFERAIGKRSWVEGNRQFPAAGMEHQHDRLLRVMCFQPVLKVIDVSGSIQPWHHGKTDPRTIFHRWLFPCIFPVSWSGNANFPALFTFACQQSFPLAVWALLIRLATFHSPDNRVIKTILIANLRTSPDSVDTGAVSLQRAMRNPTIRSAAVEYLGTSHAEVDSKVIFSLTLSSLSALLAEENVTELQRTGRDLSFLYPSSNASTSAIQHLLSVIIPPLLDSLAFRSLHESWNNSILIKKQESLRAIFTTFFASPHIDPSWKTFCFGVRAWHYLAISMSTFPAVVTPDLIYYAIKRCRFLQNNLEVGDMSNMGQAAIYLGQALADCVSAEAPDLREAVWSGMRQFDLILVDENEEPNAFAQHLFTPHTAWRFTEATCRGSAVHRGEQWFDAWIEYIHVVERLRLLCRNLITYGLESLHPFCCLWPEATSWPAVFRHLLLLFNDQGCLDSMQDAFGNRWPWPRRQLSNALVQMKEALVMHHPHLLDPEFDVPRFDEYDNPIQAWNPSVDAAFSNSHSLVTAPPSSLRLDEHPNQASEAIAFSASSAPLSMNHSDMGQSSIALGQSRAEQPATPGQPFEDDDTSRLVAGTARVGETLLNADAVGRRSVDWKAERGEVRQGIL